MTRQSRSERIWLGLGGGILGILLLMSYFSLEFLPSVDPSRQFLGPLDAFPMGTNHRGIDIWEYAKQGAKIVTLPAVCAGCVVMLLATIAGLTRCAGIRWMETIIQLASEIVGALPRLVVILVVALVIQSFRWQSLFPIAIVWAILAAPGAMDEATETAGRLGGARFVEALRAHGFSAPRIYLKHIVWLNLRPVLVRQGAEVAMQVVFLEIALSYLAHREMEPSFTHPDSTYSWANILYDGYLGLMGMDLMHAFWTGLILVGMVALMAQSFRLGARAR